jgi:apolipoprotein N-acyltransferase
MPLFMIRIFLAFFSATLLILSFSNFDLGSVAWVALVPFFLAIKGKSLKATLGLAYVTGIFFFMGVFAWINSVKGVTLLHFFIMGVYLGLYFLIFGLFLHIIHKKIGCPFLITAPTLWVTVEYLRSHVGAFGLPLALLGHTQHHNLPLIQLASFTGAYGVSFVVMMANAAIADLLACWIERRGRGEPFGLKSAPFFRGAVVLAMILILWIGGYLSLSPAPSGKAFSVAVAQGNIPPELRWKREYRDQILSKYENLSEEVLKINPQLIVWPEASTPGFVLKNMDLYQRMVTIVRRLNKHLLVGSAEYPKFSKTKVKFGKSGNTALLFSPEGKVIGQYIKIRLVPFGEHVPYEGVIPWPKFIVSPSTNSHIAGTELTLFEIEGRKFGTLICSEMMYAELSRGMVKKGAGFLVNISNEGWFGKSSFPYQFLSVCAFRAVENRVNVVRCTNTGISCFIDPYGRITGRVTNGGKDIFVEGTLTREIYLLPGGTFYTRHGDVFTYGCIAFSLGLMIWVSFKRTFKNSHP